MEAAEHLHSRRITHHNKHASLNYLVVPDSVPSMREKWYISPAVVASLSTTGRVLQLAMTHQLLAIYQSEDFVAEGGLMSYGPNVADEFRRAASDVDKILKGAKPADLPTVILVAELLNVDMP
jgi:hypothetical protein